MFAFELEPGSRVVVAFSGGPDSLCLLEILSGLVTAGKLDFKLVACHVDHMLRPCSGSDAEFCQKHADSMGIPFELRRADISSVAADEGLCLEDAARSARYHLLEEVAGEVGASAVATGHHLDDQAETVIMRILRGSGLNGLTGILPGRPISPGSDIALVRPMLEVSRKQILSYLKERKLKWLTDETNTDTSYLRNHIRANLLPLLENQYNPAIKETLARLARSALSASETLRPVIDQAYSEYLLSASKESIYLDLQGLRTANSYLLYGILEKAFGFLGYSGILTSARFELMEEAVRQGRTSGRLQPGAGLSVEFETDRLLITSEPFPDEQEAWEVEVGVPGTTEIEQAGMELVSQVLDRRDFDFELFKTSKSSMEEALDAGKAGSDLKIRPAVPGDSFRPLGLGGTKKVSDFLTDQKVPLRSKRAQLVLTAGGEIAWLMGQRVDGRFALGGETRRVLLLRIEHELGEGP
jgi:tRNA(Ile)-lysidine synthase